MAIGYFLPFRGFPRGLSQPWSSGSMLRFLFGVALVLSAIQHQSQALPLHKETRPAFPPQAVEDQAAGEKVIEEIWLQPVLVRRRVESGRVAVKNPTLEMLSVSRAVNRLRRDMGINAVEKRSRTTNEQRANSMDSRNARSGWDRSGWGGGYGK